MGVLLSRLMGVQGGWKPWHIESRGVQRVRKLRASHHPRARVCNPLLSLFLFISLCQSSSAGSTLPVSSSTTGFFSAFFDCGELHAIPAHSETLWRHSDAEICEAADSPSFAVLRVSENARRGRKLADHVNSLTKRQTSSYSRVVVKIFTLREIFRLTTPRAWT